MSLDEQEKFLTQCPEKLIAMLVGCSDQHLRNPVKSDEINQTAKDKNIAFSNYRHERANRYKL